jgi:anti-sigma regulatory factor (Ser/Thr protein kinase)
MLPDHPKILFQNSFTAEIAALPLIKSDVVDAARQTGWSSDNLGRLELVLEEGALNIIRYAYPETIGEIVITLIALEGGMLLRLEDSGIPFNPVSVPSPDLKAAPEERPIGGLGIHLMKSIADGMEYRRTSKRNILDIILNQKDN